ncbi:MAG: LysM peptidoglycan-binding domain-containing protein, partial [Calditrichota bacterium]
LMAASIQPAYAADRMKYDDYVKQLKSLQDREATLKNAIEDERSAIERLRAEIADLEKQIADIWGQIYAAIGATEAEVAEFMRRLDAIESRVNELAKMRPEILLEHAKELDQLAAQIAAMRNEKPARLSKVKARLDDLAGRIQRLKDSLPKPQHDMYSVLRGDYLWKISGKKDIYSDPWKWMRIYSANRREIKDPDLIYPKQQFRIPRQIGRDEHLVVKGETLKKIAASPDVYGDPFQWTKIYQANKSGRFLADPNMIYPEQILTIPRN